MNNKTSKSQIEVWEWKESLYDEIREIPKGKKLEYLNNKHKKSIEELFHISKSSYNQPGKTNLFTIADSD